MALFKKLTNQIELENLSKKSEIKINEDTEKDVIFGTTLTEDLEFLSILEGDIDDQKDKVEAAQNKLAELKTKEEAQRKELDLQQKTAEHQVAMEREKLQDVRREKASEGMKETPVNESDISDSENKVGKVVAGWKTEKANKEQATATNVNPRDLTKDQQKEAGFDPDDFDPDFPEYNPNSYIYNTPETKKTNVNPRDLTKDQQKEAGFDPDDFDPDFPEYNPNSYIYNK